MEGTGTGGEVWEGRATNSEPDEVSVELELKQQPIFRIDD